MGASFVELAESLMDEFLSWDPSYATQVGWHKYDHVLRDASESSTKRICRRIAELLQQLNDVSSEKLSANDRLDLDLAAYILKLKLFEIKDLKLFERESLACSEVGYSLFFLFVRDHPSFDKRLESIIDRLDKVPAFLAESREALRSPFKIWNQAALEAGLEIPALIKDIEKLAAGKSCDLHKKDQLGKVAKAAIRAVEDHNKWLKEKVIPKASPRFSIDIDEYEQYLKIKEWGVTADEALEIGEKYLELVRKQLANVAKSIVPSANPTEVLELMKSTHPATFVVALKAYREAVKRARDFLAQKNIVTIPENEKLLVLETPMFMRPMTPYAAQFEPGKFDDSRTGIFLVTPDEGQPELLREHSYAEIENTTVHEAYPGHHLQGICSNTNPSRIRILIASPDFSEGWGLYCEELMISSGFNDNPLGRFTYLNDLMFRIARMIVEVRLAKGGFTIDEGAQLFVDECGMDKKTSWIEARSCAMSPTYYSSYFLGKLSIMQLREDVQRALGKKFSLRLFHDWLLYSGCLPLRFMRRAVAQKMKEQFDADLGPQRETLHEYAMRKLGEDGS
ncbi:MAG: DUF885 domain-containing protein [Thermoplasmata archaeon]